MLWNLAIHGSLPKVVTPVIQKTPHDTVGAVGTNHKLRRVLAMIQPNGDSFVGKHVQPANGSRSEEGSSRCFGALQKIVIKLTAEDIVNQRLRVPSRVGILHSKRQTHSPHRAPKEMTYVEGNVAESAHLKAATAGLLPGEVTGVQDCRADARLREHVRRYGPRWATANHHYVEIRAPHI
jgi:hypothetical protein